MCASSASARSATVASSASRRSDTVAVIVCTTYCPERLFQQNIIQYFSIRIKHIMSTPKTHVRSPSVGRLALRGVVLDLVLQAPVEVRDLPAELLLRVLERPQGPRNQEC